MILEGFEVRGIDERKREKNDSIVKRWTVTLKNKDVSTITVTTERKSIRDLIVGNDIDVEVRQAQATLIAGQ
jgi:hypothetical protein